MSTRFEFDKDDVPLHFERVSMNRWVLLAGWIATATGVALGVALAAGAQRLPAEALGVLLAGLGGVMAVVLARCRRVETVVTRRLLTMSAGPLRRRVPVGFIDGFEARAATSWRRLYAGRELVLGVGHDGRQVIIPTANLDGLASVLGSQQ